MKLLTPKQEMHAWLDSLVQELEVIERVGNRQSLMETLNTAMADPARAIVQHAGPSSAALLPYIQESEQIRLRGVAMLSETVGDEAVPEVARSVAGELATLRERAVGRFARMRRWLFEG